MTTPIISLTAAILYFGWLWHGGSVAHRSEDGSPNQRVKDSTRIKDP
jgi:hypothetical protein